MEVINNGYVSKRKQRKEAKIINKKAYQKQLSTGIQDIWQKQ